MTKLRMTAQSKVNIQAAKSATLIPASGGYKVELTGASGKTCEVENQAGPIIYSSMAAAKKAVSTHNRAIEAELKPTI